MMNENINEKINEIYVSDELAEEKFKELLNKIVGSNSDPKCFNVWGVGGTGKSRFVMHIDKHLCNFKNKVDHIYVNISSCNSDLDILYYIACSLNSLNSLETESKDRFFRAFIFNYRWHYRNITDFEGKTVDMDANSSLGKELAGVFVEKGIDEFSAKLLKNIVAPVFMGFVPELVTKIAVFIKDEAKKKEFKKYIDEMRIYESNQTLWQIRLKEKFMSEMQEFMKEFTKDSEIILVIILDNYKNNADIKISLTDTDWIFGENGLLKLIKKDILLVISSRDELEKDDIPLLEKYNLKGFTDENAEKYINKCWWELFGKNENLTENIISKIKDLSKIDDEKERFYSPIYLNQLMKQIVALCNDAYEEMNEVQREERICRLLKKPSENLKFYFSSDLSETMLGVFQILSCLDIWDEEWISFVQKKFTHHLLNARHVLNTKSSVEELKDKRFKIHEQVRDEIFKSPMNLIKYDVAEYFFQYMMQIYGDKDNIPESWKSNMEGIKNLVELSIEYIGSVREAEEAKEYYKKLKNCLDNIYSKNKSEGDVTDQFIAVYENIIKKLNDDKLTHIVSMEDKILFNASLGDLYTNIFKVSKAIEVEKETMRLAEENIKKHPLNADNIWKDYLDCFKINGLYLKMVNAYAYDNSGFWNYDEALDKGTKALEGIEECMAGENGIFTKLISSIEELDKLDQSAVDSLNLFRKLMKKTVYINDEEFWKLGENIECCDFDKVLKAFNILINTKNKAMEVFNILVNTKDDKGDSEKYKGIFKAIEKVIDAMKNNLSNIWGNYAWYYLRASEGARERVEGIDPVAFGIKVYLFRKAYALATEDLDFMKNKVLLGYHNISVYAFKSGMDSSTLFYMGENIVNKSSALLKKRDISKLNENQIKRKQELYDDKEQRNTCVDISRKPSIFNRVLRLIDIPIDKVLTENENIIKYIQYLGDFYLHAGERDKVYGARERFAQTFLYRYIYLGINSSKTLSSGCRLAIACYFMDIQSELAADLMDMIVNKVESLQKYGAVSNGNARLAKYKKIREMLSEKHEIEEFLTELDD